MNLEIFRLIIQNSTAAAKSVWLSVGYHWGKPHMRQQQHFAIYTRECGSQTAAAGCYWTWTETDIEYIKVKYRVNKWREKNVVTMSENKFRLDLDINWWLYMIILYQIAFLWWWWLHRRKLQFVNLSFQHATVSNGKILGAKRLLRSILHVELFVPNDNPALHIFMCMKIAFSPLPTGPAQSRDSRRLSYMIA